MKKSTILLIAIQYLLFAFPYYISDLIHFIFYYNYNYEFPAYNRMSKTPEPFLLVLDGTEIVKKSIDDFNNFVHLSIKTSLKNVEILID